MVKPDVKHNYYADLDLPTNASIEDVRKAYRKLALQFHPDRNAGKEAECVPRFQAIQAANEVLCDPTTKARYDADRRKVGLYPSTTYKPNVPSPGNPYAASSAFPPPPRRTQPGQSTYQRSGADRFTHFPRAANTAPRKDPASERTEQFRAWQSMNTGTQRPAPPPPPRPAASPKPPPTPNGRPNAPRQDTKLPSEEQIRAGMRHGKAPTADTETLNARQTAWQEYGKSGTNRSKSQRPAPTTPKRTGGFDPNAPGSDERAAPQSSHYRRGNRSDDFLYPPPPPGPPPASSPRSPVSPQPTRPFADPLRSFRQREDAPYMEGNRTSTPYSSLSGEKTQFSSEGLRRSASTRDTTALHPEGPESPQSSTRARSTSPLGRQQKQTNGKQTRTPRPPSFMPGMESSSSNPSSDAEPAPRERKIAQPKPRRDRFPNHEPSSPQPGPTSNAQPTHDVQSEPEQPDMQQRKSSTNIFNIPINHDTFTSTGIKSRSEENINTNFSPEGWSGKFAGSTDYFAQETPGRKRSPTRRAGSRRGLYTPDSGSASESMPPPPPPDSTRPRPQPPLDSTTPVPLNGKFSEEEWKSTFKDASWTWPPPPSTAPPTDPKPGLRSKVGSRKASKLSSKSSHPSSASNPSSHAASGTRDSPVVLDGDDVAPEPEPDAMDIDTPPPTRPVSDDSTTTQPISGAKGARVYSVPISEWRQQQAEANRENPTAKRQARTTPVEPQLTTNLDDLANVEPIARSADGGLRNLADLSSTLPFTSQPSNSATSGKDSQLLQIPPLPKVPMAPNKWTKSSWHEYAQRFAAYLQHHHQFTRTVLAHFEARERLSEERMRDASWLEASGDVFESYARDLRQDEKVREVWNLAEERHGEAVKGFEGSREQIRRIVNGGGLAD